MNLMSSVTSADSAWDRRRWLILGVIALAQLMVVLDLTVMDNVALPSGAAAALHFTTVDRQWVVTAYTLAFGSLLLLGGRLADLLGRKVEAVPGRPGRVFASAVSAVGGALVNFAMLITARALPGRASAALLVPSALSLLTTYVHRAGRTAAGRVAVYGAIAGASAARWGLLPGGALTEYLSWAVDAVRGTLIFAAVGLRRRQEAAAAGAPAVPGQRPGWTSPACWLVSGALFALVYGSSPMAAAHSLARLRPPQVPRRQGAVLLAVSAVVDEPGGPSICCRPCVVL